MPMVIFTGNVTAKAIGIYKLGFALGTTNLIAAGTAMYEALAPNIENRNWFDSLAVTNLLK